MMDTSESGPMSWMDSRLEVRGDSGTHGRGGVATGGLRQPCLCAERGIRGSDEPARVPGECRPGRPVWA